MKLKKIAHLALCCALVFLAGCSGNKNAEEEAVVTEAPTETPTPEPTADPTASPEPEPTVSPEPAEVLPEGMVRSYLTGEPVAEEIGRRRPAAVMINNIEACLPHWGISHAGFSMKRRWKAESAGSWPSLKITTRWSGSGRSGAAGIILSSTPPALKLSMFTMDNPPTQFHIWICRR